MSTTTPAGPTALPIADLPVPKVAIDGDSAFRYAQALVDYADGLKIERHTFSLPRFRLTVASDSENYMPLCRRALVDDVRLASNQRDMLLSVLDYPSHPEMPRDDWTGEFFSTELIENGLAAGGFVGRYELGSRIWQVLSARQGKGVEALYEPGRFPPWVASFPLHNLLHWAYQEIGWRIVHAGTLAIDGRGVMLIGAGGAGKSGTTLSGIVNGLDSTGDDYVAMSIDDGAVRAAPVMKLMKQDGLGLARLGLDPVALGLGDINWQNKYEFDFEQLGAGRRAASIAFKAMLMPRIANAPRSKLTRAPTHAAMMALAPSNLRQLPRGMHEGLQFTAGIARRLPAYFLELSSDPAEIADTIGEFILKGAP